MKPDKPTLLSTRFVTQSETGESKNLYRQAELCREALHLVGRRDGQNKLLEYIAEEVKIRVKITQQEIFLIGELLSHARELLKGQQGKFKEWIEKNFNFGYHTALNFCNVYVACSGYLELVKNVKPSILYKISSDQFPTELRELLVFEDLLKNLKNEDIKNIYTEFKEKGFEEVKEKLIAKSKVALSVEHSRRHLDSLSKAIHSLEGILYNLERLERHVGSEIDKGITEIGDSVNSTIIKAIRRSVADLKNIQNVAVEKFVSAKKKSKRKPDDTAIISPDNQEDTQTDQEVIVDGKVFYLPASNSTETEGAEETPEIES